MAKDAYLPVPMPYHAGRNPPFGNLPISTYDAESLLRKQSSQTILTPPIRTPNTPLRSLNPIRTHPAAYLQPTHSPNPFPTHLPLTFSTPTHPVPQTPLPNPQTPSSPLYSHSA